jgi:hypothetical protein
VVVLTMLAGCGGGDDEDAGGVGTGAVATTSGGGQSSPAAQTPDPCTLVTVEEVSAAIGSPVETPEGTDFGPPVGGRSCLFSNSDGPPFKSFQIVVRTDGDFAEALRDQGQTVEKLYQDTKNLIDGPVDDVTGLGQQAYKTDRGYYVLKDGVALETNLGLNADPSPEAQAALQTLTEKAVSRL